MIKAVIFDSDGMLTHGNRFSDTYVKDHDISMSEMDPFFNGPFKDCLIGKADLREELKKGWLEKWKWQGSVDNLLKYWFGTGNNLDKEVFETIKQITVPKVLATNQEKYRTEYLNNEFGYDQVFNKIFSSAFVGAKKPNSEFFERIYVYFKELGPSIEKNEVLFWDDDVENVEGAGNYGFTSIQYWDYESYRSKMVEFELLK